MRVPNYRYVEYLIEQAETLPEIYKAFDVISDYLETYNVGYMAYRTLFDCAMDKYKEIENEKQLHFCSKT